VEERLAVDHREEYGEGQWRGLAPTWTRPWPGSYSSLLVGVKDYSLGEIDDDPVFWVEGPDRKWQARPTPGRFVEELASERSFSAVKSALKSFLDAPATGFSKRTPKGKSDA
jgi:hypothetical protein